MFHWLKVKGDIIPTTLRINLPVILNTPPVISSLLYSLQVLYFRSMVTHRGHTKKIKFGPGRGNNKLAALYNDGIDIWDLQKVS